MAWKFLSRFVNNIPECSSFRHGVPKIWELVLPWHMAVQLDLPVWFLCKNALFANQRCPSYAAPSKTKPETKLILYCAQLVHNPDKPVTVLKNRTGKANAWTASELNILLHSQTTVLFLQEYNTLLLLHEPIPRWDEMPAFHQGFHLTLSGLRPNPFALLMLLRWLLLLPTQFVLRKKTTSLQWIFTQCWPLAIFWVI